MTPDELKEWEEEEANLEMAAIGERARKEEYPIQESKRIMGFTHIEEPSSPILLWAFGMLLVFNRA